MGGVGAKTDGIRRGGKREGRGRRKGGEHPALK